MDTPSLPRTCTHCHDPIPTDNPRALYCSNKCRLAANKAQRLATLKASTPLELWPRCAQCTEPFLSLKANQTTCSARCARILSAAAINARRTPAPGPTQGDPRSISRRAVAVRGKIDHHQPVGEDAARLLWLDAGRKWEQICAQKSPTDSQTRLVMVGYGCSLKVEKGALVAYEGHSDHPAGRLYKTLWPGTHGLSAIIITGTVGTLTGEALTWCRKQKISLMIFDRDADELAYLGPPPKRDQELRQAQRALTPEGRLSLARWLIRKKLEAQMATLLAHPWLPRAAEGADYLRQCLAWWDVPGATPLSTPERLTIHEANAAAGYFGAWKGYELPWRKRDLPHLPPRYRAFEGRVSPLSGTPQKAADPLNAMLNYCYGILARDVHHELVKGGFDTDIGVLHTDQCDALVFDVMEPLRAMADDLLLRLLRASTLRYGDATPITNGTRPIVPPPQDDGECRLHPELLRSLASCCSLPHRPVVALCGTLSYRLRHGLAAD